MSDRADLVRLEIPASPEYVLLARLTVTGVATRAGMGFESIEDLRVLVAETCRLLMGETGTKGTVVLTYSVAGDQLVLDGHVDHAPDEPVADDDLSLLLIGALADDHSLSSEGGSRSVRTVKSLTLR